MKHGSVEADDNPLTHHELRRRRGIPFISVRIGPVGEGIALFRDFARQHGRGLAIARSPHMRALFHAWLSAALAALDLDHHALAFASHQLGAAPERIQHVTGARSLEREQLLQQLADLGPGGMVAGAMLDLGATTALHEAAARARDQHATIDLWTALAGLIPASELPLLLLVPTDWTDHMHAHRGAIHDIVRLVESIPQLPVGMVLSAQSWQELHAVMPDNHVLAVLRQGVFTPRMAPALAASDKDRDKDKGDGFHQSRQALHQAGVSDALWQEFEAAVEAAAGAPSAASGEPSLAALKATSSARSHPEQFLFDVLEQKPETVGFFELNGKLDMLFGNRPAEVDLLCRPLRIAVELDGHWHFTSPDHYRRDRRKDAQLQQSGFFVLRFLADDVVSHLETILGVVIETIACRRRDLDPGDLT